MRAGNPQSDNALHAHGGSSCAARSRRGGRRRAALLALGIPMLAGCTAVAPGNGPSSKVYVGIIRVQTPASTGTTSVTDVRAIGLGVDGGPWAGFRKASWIAANPRECQLVIIIRSNVEAASAAAVLRSLEGQNPCIIDYNRSSAR